MQGEADVAADDVAGQLQFGGAHLGGGLMGLVQGLGAGIALAAPEVQGVAQAQFGIVVPGGAIGQLARAIEAVGGPAVALEGALALDLQGLAGFGQAGQGLGAAHPGGGRGQTRVVGQGGADPGIQLGIAIGAPPLARGPGGLAGGGLDGGVGGQRLIVETLRLGRVVTGTDTAGQQGREGDHRERRPGSARERRHVGVRWQQGHTGVWLRGRSAVGEMSWN